ncbi:MAG: Gx transporter family protein [Aristaeellaceae bacterium]
MNKRFTTKRIAICSLLLALMIILGWVEKQMIPPTVQGVKLGLSNSLLIFAVYMLDIPTAYVLMIFKVFLSNLLFGSLFPTLFIGLSGGLLSLTAMVLVSRIKGMHPVTVSVIGGVSHNMGQLPMAMVVASTPQLVTLLPWLMIAGVVSGLITGVCADRVLKYMKHVHF